MTIAEMLLSDFDTEAISTRRVLERVPDDRFDWKPHEKSMTLKQLARHVATLPYFGWSILTTDTFDFATDKQPHMPETANAEELVKLAAGAAAEIRTALASLSDEALEADWTLNYQGSHIATGKRLTLYRTMFFNHLIHHRGQLTVYLRLLDVKVPGIYGPSADEPFGG